MRINRSKGNSFTKFETGDELARGLDLNRSTGQREGRMSPTSMSDYLATDPDLIIRQVISVVDKIIRKPKSLTQMTVDWFDARSFLGAACWDLLTERHLSDNADGEWEKVWRWKLHPYAEFGTEEGDRKAIDETQERKRAAAKKNKKLKLRTPDFRGRWFERFVPDVHDIDVHQVARDIERHLFEEQFSIHGGVAGHGGEIKNTGLIRNRSYGIQQSVYKKSASTAELSWINDWTEAEQRSYLNPDIAKTIKGLAKDKEDGKQRLTSEDVGKKLFQHYADIGLADPRQKGTEQWRKLDALHRAVKQFYREKIRNSKRGRSNQPSQPDGTQLRPLSSALPNNCNQLFDLIGKQRSNRLINDLIRHGRHTYHVATAQPHTLTQAHVPQPNDAESYFWTSDGQAQIKRAEAFSRVWRNVISDAARSAKSWADPSGEVTIQDQAKDGRDLINDDILSDIVIREVTGNRFDDSGYRARLNVLFGSKAGWLVGNSEADRKNTLLAALKIAAKLRTAAIHFSDRQSFSKALKDSIATLTDTFEMTPGTNPVTQQTQTALVGFYRSDQEDRSASLKAELEAVGLPGFVDPPNISQLISATVGSAVSDLPLPTFNRVLDRLDGIKQATEEDGNPLVDERQKLPPRANTLEMAEPHALCKFTCMKLIYERPFREWLNNQPIAELQKAADQTTVEATERAQNSQEGPNPFIDLILGKSTGIPSVGDGGLIKLFDDLAQMVATELRHHNGYEPDPDAARKQSKWIEDFKCDLLALLFARYLNDNGFDWLLEMNDQTKKRDFEENWFPETDAGSLSEEAWEANLYTFLHLVPVDDIARLMHQFRKTAVLETQSEKEDAAGAVVERVKSVLDLYMAMNNAKFNGDAINIGLSGFEDFFEKPEDFKMIYGDEDNQATMQTRRGLRQILRFGHLDSVSDVFAKHKVKHSDVEFVLGLENRAVDKTTRIQRYQRERQLLHRSLVKARADVPLCEFNLYTSLRDVVTTHKHRAAQVRLTNHARLHQVMMRVIARLIDYAGVWERDAFFVFLALIKHQRELGEAGARPVPKEFPTANNLRARKIKEDKKWLDWLTDDNRALFNRHFGPDKAKIRNDFAHFNILSKHQLPLDLTHQVNRVRDLMSYDRKLKNAVSKSIKELLEREGVVITWEMQSHRLADAKIAAKQFRHLAEVTVEGINKKHTPSIIEQAHSDEFLGMMATIFNGSVATHSDQSPGKTMPPGNQQRNKAATANSGRRQTTPRSPNHGYQGSSDGAKVTGVVKWFNTAKGYGFICPDNGGQDVFLHVSDLSKSGIEKLDTGDKVRFMLAKADKGKLKAVALERA